MNAPNKNNKQVQKLNENKLMFRVISVMQNYAKHKRGLMMTECMIMELEIPLRIRLFNDEKAIAKKAQNKMCRCTLLQKQELARLSASELFDY